MIPGRSPSGSWYQLGALNISKTFVNEYVYSKHTAGLIFSGSCDSWCQTEDGVTSYRLTWLTEIYPRHPCPYGFLWFPIISHGFPMVSCHFPWFPAFPVRNHAILCSRDGFFFDPKNVGLRRWGLASRLGGEPNLWHSMKYWLVN